MSSFRRVRYEIKHPLWVLQIGHGIWLESMHHVRKFQRITDKENLQIVADQVPVAILCIELCGEATWITKGLRRVHAMNYR